MGAWQVVMAGGFAGGLMALTACGGGAPPAPAPAPAQVAKPGEPTELRPKAKIPRAPFLALSDDMGATLGKAVLAKGANRKLALPAQRGPFGPKESVTLFWTEDLGDTQGIGGAVIVDSTAYQLPVANDLPLDAPPEVVWAGTERGWQAVLLLRRVEADQRATQQNQVFTWDGQQFARDPVSEDKVRTYTSPDAIRQALH